MNRKIKGAIQIEVWTEEWRVNLIEDEGLLFVIIKFLKAISLLFFNFLGNPTIPFPGKPKEFQEPDPTMKRLETAING